MGRCGRKKKYKNKRPVSYEEIEQRIEVKPPWGIRQFRSTAYWLDTSGHVYRKKGGKKYKPIEIYEFHGYYNFDMYIIRRGKEVKKRIAVHRAMLECYYTDNTLQDIRSLTVHHLSGNRYDNSVNNLYACTRCKHDILENEELQVKSNFDMAGNGGEL